MTCKVSNFFIFFFNLVPGTWKYNWMDWAFSRHVSFCFEHRSVMSCTLSGWEAGTQRYFECWCGGLHTSGMMALPCSFLIEFSLLNLLNFSFFFLNLCEGVAPTTSRDRYFYSSTMCCQGSHLCFSVVFWPCHLLISCSVPQTSHWKSLWAGFS